MAKQIKIVALAPVDNIKRIVRYGFSLPVLHAFHPKKSA